jgi:hypothetical protein
LYFYQKTPYSLTILRSYIPALIIIPFLIVGLIIEWGGQNRGANNILRVSAIAFIFYSIFLYIYTIFVAFKQKDKINLRANFFFWWSCIMGVLLLPLLGAESILVFILLSLFWIFPLIWWANKYRKTLNAAKLKANQTV